MSFLIVCIMHFNCFLCVFGAKKRFHDFTCKYGVLVRWLRRWQRAHFLCLHKCARRLRLAHLARLARWRVWRVCRRRTRGSGCLHAGRRSLVRPTSNACEAHAGGCGRAAAGAPWPYRASTRAAAPPTAHGCARAPSSGSSHSAAAAHDEAAAGEAGSGEARERRGAADRRGEDASA